MRSLLLASVVFSLVISPLWAQQGGEGVSLPGMLIEAERFDRKQPEKDFANPTREKAASGCKVLAKFYGEGRVYYRFKVDEAGTWRVWLRYGAKNAQKLLVGVDAAAKADFIRVDLPATGGYIGSGVWGWQEIFQGPLKAGEHELTLGSASMRIDCLFLTTAPQKPTDELIRFEPEPVQVDAKTRALLDRELIAVRPAWLDGAMDYRLPAWYEEHRVHLHTRLSLPWYHKKPDLFFNAGHLFREMGARVFARHIKSGGEGAWWPSVIGTVAPEAKQRNLAKEVIDEAHRAGCRILVYHRHMEDEAMAKEHPDWVSLDCHGKPYVKRQTKLCFNSPYADYLEQRMLELAALRADAFYFDEVHMEKAGCWCAHCRQKFTELTGLEHPAEASAADPVWHRLVDFTNLSIEQTFLKWRKTLHAKYPNVVMMVGSHTWPIMTERHMTGRLFRIADSMKTEFNLPVRRPATEIFPLPEEMKPCEPDAKIALGYTLARDACDGRPAHIWTHGVPDEAAAVHAAAGIMTHGCIANLDVSEGTIPNPMFKAALAMGDRVSPHLAGTRPVRWAALHYSELARDRHILQPKEAWREVLYPLYGAYQTLLRQHLPVGILTDSQLEEGLLDGYQVLFLPAPDAMTAGMQKAVAQFEARGGTVVRQRADWQWHDAERGQQQAAAALMECLRTAVAAAPVQVRGGPERMHSVVWRRPGGSALVVALASDFSWVQTGRKHGKDDEATSPAPCRDVVIVLAPGSRPRRAVEAVTGQNLAVGEESGRAVVRLPEFQAMAVVAVE